MDKRLRFKAPREAFSLIELLVVLAIIGILAGLILPGLSKAKANANAIRCLNHKRQLQLGWALYANDNADRIVPNGEVDFGPPRADRKYWWAQGIMNYEGSHPDNTNTALLVDPTYARLGDYAKSPDLYKCPEDKSSVLIAGSAHGRVRSVSMNVHVGRCVDCFADDLPTHLGPKTTAGIPNASMQFIFLDEHPDSINTTAFLLSSARGASTKIVSFPGSYHKGAATISFADGHVENHRWRDPRTKPSFKREKILVEVRSTNNEDINWLQERTLFP